jgi:hypothetical protein
VVTSDSLICSILVYAALSGIWIDHDKFCRYFDMPYTLPKLDMVAIPDFAFGAMENYGLVTYRETALLYDDQHSAASNKQRVMCTCEYCFFGYNLVWVML